MSARDIAKEISVEVDNAPWNPELRKRLYARASVPSVSSGYRSQGVPFEGFPLIQALAGRAQARMVEMRKVRR
jgi:hypothetical protein